MVAQPGRSKVEGRLAVGKCSDDAGARPDLAENAFQPIVGNFIRNDA